MSNSIEQGARLETLLKALKFKQIAFAKAVGVSQGFIAQVINGKKNISYGTQNKILEAFPAVNLNWLLTGEGEMFIGATSEEPPHGRSVVEEPGERYEVGGGLLERMLRELEQLRARDEARAQELERLQQRVEELEARAVEGVTV